MPRYWFPRGSFFRLLIPLVVWSVHSEPTGDVSTRRVGTSSCLHTITRQGDHYIWQPTRSESRPWNRSTYLRWELPLLTPLDSPGHAYSWGKAYPQIILDCANMISRSKGYPGINNVPFDITNNFTYQIVDSVMGDIAQMFSDSFIHLG